MSTINSIGTWNIDPSHSEISFKVKHMMITTVTGHFENFEGRAIASKEEFIDADFSFSADISSINTKNKDRDNHLRSADFFDASTYPHMKFQSKSYDGKNLIGDLTIKDVTKEVTLQMEFGGAAVDPYSNTKAGFEIRGKISRKEFNLTWNAVTEAGSVVVSDTVNLVIDLQAIKS